LIEVAAMDDMKKARRRLQRFYLMRKIVMWCLRRSCGTCLHYDGRFGEDCCFECERTIDAPWYQEREGNG